MENRKETLTKLDGYFNTAGYYHNNTDVYKYENSCYEPYADTKKYENADCNDTYEAWHGVNKEYNHWFAASDVLELFDEDVWELILDPQEAKTEKELDKMYNDFLEKYNKED